MSRQPNLLLIILDSARARNMSLYDYEKNTTPFLNEFTERATVYTQARSPSIHSIASHISMFTGQHVEQHRATNHTVQIDPDSTVWAELQSKYDYDTGLFTNNRVISSASNLDDCFEYSHSPTYHIVKQPNSPRCENGYDPISADENGIVNHIVSCINHNHPIRSLTNYGEIAARSAARTAEQILRNAESDYMTTHGESFSSAFLSWSAKQLEPWAACLNLMDTHYPFEPEPTHNRWATEEDWNAQAEEQPSTRELLRGNNWGHLKNLEPLYDGSIHQADQIVENLISELENRGQLDDTLVIITSDHGEAFGERSQVDPSVRLKGHSWGIHEVQTHVPLVIKFPEQHQGRVVDEVVSLTDLPLLFQSAVQGTIDDTVLVSDGPVLASTFRLLEEDAAKYGEIDGIERFTGPWRTMYESCDDGVKKTAVKGDCHFTGVIPDTQKVHSVSREANSRVLDEFARISDSDIVTEESTEIEEDVEDHLEDLGYIR